jgi:hypothetical protein
MSSGTSRLLPFLSPLLVVLFWPSHGAHSTACVCALLLETSLVRRGHSSLLGLTKKFRRLRPLCTHLLDEYDQFAIEFEQVLRADNDAEPAESIEQPNCVFIDHHNHNHDDLIQEATEISEYYRRDLRDDNSKPIVDPIGLAKLLVERYQARQAKNFKRVSLVDHRLGQEHGVRAYDHPRIWTRLKEPPAAHVRRQADKRAAEMKRMYGPNGHPYSQMGRQIDPMLCSLTMRDIHTLLMQRTRSELESRSEDGDAIQLELLVHGIQVRDDLYQWTADPWVNFEETPTGKGRQEPPRAAIYTLKGVPEPLYQAQMRIQQRIEQLVKCRAEALFLGETQLARFLLFELYKTYGVGVDDPSCTWSIAGVFYCNDGNPMNDDDDKGVAWESPSLGETLAVYLRPSAHFPPLQFAQDYAASDSLAYRRSIHSLALEDERALDRVIELAQERIHKREEGKFLEADAIRNELWHTYVSF